MAATRLWHSKPPPPLFDLERRSHNWQVNRPLTPTVDAITLQPRPAHHEARYLQIPPLLIVALFLTISYHTHSPTTNLYSMADVDVPAGRKAFVPLGTARFPRGLHPRASSTLACDHGVYHD